MFTERYGQGNTPSPHGLEPGYVLQMSDGSYTEVIVVVTPWHYIWRRLYWWHRLGRWLRAQLRLN